MPIVDAPIRDFRVQGVGPREIGGTLRRADAIANVNQMDEQLSQEEDCYDAFAHEQAMNEIEPSRRAPARGLVDSWLRGGRHHRACMMAPSGAHQNARDVQWSRRQVRAAFT